ncbi:putative pentatricopeptide repeat-containing protein At3g23330 [Amborella trichopoda]|uniref:putative pentatricopeptide repeat-containing protein At3g23330 n=1 Tax=Amborella trichopoda TaxID=13333 RepID=UPI0009BDFF02|nr:putative pentatricopeptide repeat-containing protein At3g23330 [Amborella trichopoda]|eukprot:XP_020531158.1 putative pentatricopeptide repeat-containing protein At3g23330 [Amborella trichopoda]
MRISSCQWKSSIIRIIPLQAPFSKFTKQDHFLSETTEIHIKSSLQNAINSKSSLQIPKILHQMIETSIPLDTHTYHSLLLLSRDILSLKQGKQIHANMCRSNSISNIFLSNRLIGFYVESRSLMYARRVFDEMFMKNVYSYNTLISGHVNEGLLNQAHQLFNEMPERDTISYNTLISGYAKLGHKEEALELFKSMVFEGLRPNGFSFTSILGTFSSILETRYGAGMHGFITKAGFEGNVVIANSIIDMYAKCGEMENAEKLFCIMPDHDEISWTSLVCGFAKNGEFWRALKIFREMVRSTMELDTVIFASVISGAAWSTALEEGTQLHCLVVKRGVGGSVYVGSVLVDMYAKCGKIESSSRVFEEMQVRNVVSWNAMISGLAQNGHADRAILIFENMKTTRRSTKPNESTFIAVLTACCHAGLINRAKTYFQSMVEDYGIGPRLDHYSCMADLLGRAGHVKEAAELITSMPMEPDAVIWGSLLSASEKTGDVEIAEKAAKMLFELEPEDDGPYVSLSNVYAGARRWEEVKALRERMRCHGVKKGAGCSWIAFENENFEFST